MIFRSGVDVRRAGSGSKAVEMSGMRRAQHRLFGPPQRPSDLPKEEEPRRKGAKLDEITQSFVYLGRFLCEVALTPHPRAQDAMRRSRHMTTDRI